MTLENWNTRNQEKIATLNARIAHNSEKIALLNSQLEALDATAKVAFAVALPPLVPRQSVPKNKLLPWGGLTRQTLQYLRMTMGTPVTSREIADAIATSLPRVLSAEERKKLNKSVWKALYRLHEQAMVTRVTTRDIPGYYSTWVIKENVA